MWTLYQIDCEKGIVYIGISQNVRKRWAQHRWGRGTSATRAFKPLSFRVLKEYDTKHEAARAESKMVAVLRSQGRFAYGAGNTRVV